MSGQAIILRYRRDFKLGGTGRTNKLYYVYSTSKDLDAVLEACYDMFGGRPGGEMFEERGYLERLGNGREDYNYLYTIIEPNYD